MKLTVLSDDGQVVCVGCEGEISQLRFQADGNPLENLLGPGCWARRVVLDMDRAEWIDSSGISWLISSRKNFNTSGGSLILCRVPPRVSQVLVFCNMDRLFPIAADPAAAKTAALGGKK